MQRGPSKGCKRTCVFGRAFRFRAERVKNTVVRYGVRHRYTSCKVFALCINKGGTAELVLSSFEFSKDGSFLFLLCMQQNTRSLT